MKTGWRYRLLSIIGVCAITAAAVLVANHRIPQYLFTTYVPVFNRLPVTVYTGEKFVQILSLSIGFTVVTLLPLYKPRPRRHIDTVTLVQKRTLVAGLALATLGYFNRSHSLPRATLVMATGILMVALPLWFVLVRRAPSTDPDRVLIVGDDIDQIRRIHEEVSMPFIGYLCPTTVSTVDSRERVTAIVDGGDPISNLERLGGLSRLNDTLVERDVDTVVLAFQQSDREEFFGALNICSEHGVATKVHYEYADSVLTSESSSRPLIDVEIEPWDLQDYLVKRGFDITFAVTGLIVFAPLIACIAVLIKLDSDGPVLYRQKRTAGLGGRLTVFKFRTMYPEGESSVPIEDEENDRITRVGRMLRKTHLDELPQLWLILVGKMSTVGPRPVWTDEEALLEDETEVWRKRWFVKPGLTGLAQIRGAGSTTPEAKLRSDLEYIRRQSFLLDCYILFKQIWLVVLDVASY
ncbi:sugar transferase [Natrinema sp. CGMCC1.2065]|uniref:sugar transferase n=1 Tax=Natrinema sp. CGMCC1.2065 TaxID=3445767 RepID=UPI003F4A7066